MTKCLKLPIIFFVIKSSDVCLIGTTRVGHADTWQGRRETRLRKECSISFTVWVLRDVLPSPLRVLTPASLAVREMVYLRLPLQRPYPTLYNTYFKNTSTL
jgi:hypothetical protein